MNKFVFLIAVFIFNFQLSAQEYEGLVKLTNEETIINGIVVGENLILSTSDNVPDKIEAEFYGANHHRFKSKAIVIKRDEKLNLSLLKYTKPTPIKGAIRIYRPISKRFNFVDIEGWNSYNTRYLFANVQVSPRMDLEGYPRVEMGGFAVFNKGELVGIQTYKNRQRIYCIWANDIIGFINEI